MAVKKADFKQILLDKGERIGLCVGLVVMALMVIGFGLGSALSEGPQKKVSALESLRKQAQAAYDQSQPDDGLDKLPPELNAVAVKPIDPDLYPAKWAYFQSLSTEDRKWRQPAVLGPDEFQIALVRGEVQIYIINEDAQKNLTIGVLKSKSAAALTEEQKQERDKFAKAIPGRVASATKPKPRRQIIQPIIPGTIPGVPGAQAIPGSSGAPGGIPAPGIGRPGREGQAGSPLPGLPGLQGINKAAVQEQELKMVPVSKLGEENGTLAQTSYPVRVLQVSAAFPYRAQLEEFRKALRLNALDDLFLDRVSTPEFTGYSVQRKVYRPDGSVAQDWMDFDDQAPVKYLRIRTNEFEPEDPVLEADGLIAHPNRLVVPHPKLYGPPREFKWPEPRLEGLERAREEMEKALKDNAPPPPKAGESRFKDIDLFDENQSSKNPGGDPTMPERGPARLPAAPRTSDGRPIPGGRNLPGERDLPGGTQGDLHKPAVFPEHVLVRFLDVTVQPGYSYEYRIKVRMANPNFEQPERAVSNRLTKDKEIEGGWVDVTWTKDGQKMSRFHVSDELLYYVVQGDGQGDGNSKKNATNKDQVVMQVQRWLENVRTRPDQQSNELPVGDWSILKERVVRRGEYVGKWAEVEVPAWIISQNRYGLAVQPDEMKALRGRGGNRYVKHKGIPVDFASDPVTNAKALVVDFEGGERTVTLDGKPKKIHGPVEMLVFTADGKLVVHNSQRDTADPERQKRLQEWEQWLTQVKNQADNPNPGGPNDVFSPRKGRTPGG